MKKLLLGLTVLITNLSLGQITLENTYTTEGFNNNPSSYAFMTDSGLNYYTLNESNNQLKIYNSTHALYKTVNLNVGTGFTVQTVYLVTDKLFNSNSKIEFIVISRNGTPNSSKMTLFDEDGINLFEFGDRWEANCFKAGENNFKLIVSTDKDSPNNYDIYSLPGVLSIDQQNNLLNRSFFGFPNPASNMITIVNSLESGEKSMLEVFDVNGKKVIEKNISSGTPINLDISNLANGVYIYKLKNNTNRFIKK